MITVQATTLKAVPIFTFDDCKVHQVKIWRCPNPDCNAPWWSEEAAMDCCAPDPGPPTDEELEEEVKERRRIWDKTYLSKPDVKERRLEYQRTRRSDPEVREKANAAQNEARKRKREEILALRNDAAAAPTVRWVNGVAWVRKTAYELHMDAIWESYKRVQPIPEKTQ